MQNPFLIISKQLEALDEKINLVLSRQNKDEPKRELRERFINKKEAAEIASVSTSTVDNWARSDKITRHYFGGAVRFWLPELLEFLKSQRV